MSGLVVYNYWMVIGRLLSLIKFDEQLHQETQIVVYPKVSEATVDYLMDQLSVENLNARQKGSNWTRADGQFNFAIFSMLRLTFLPIIKTQISKGMAQEAI
jgi:hypothetical protein